MTGAVKAESLAAALARLQAELPEVGKENTADAGSYSYSYADLASCSRAIMPLLAKHGLSFSAKPTFVEGGFRLVYILRHESGEADEGQYPLPDPVRSTPQQIGSAITYGRRYALCAVTGLAPAQDDDDGKAAHDAHDRAAEREREEERRRGQAQEFIADFIRRVGEASTTVELAALQAEGKRKTQGGLITAADARALVELLNERDAALKADGADADQTEIPV